MSRRRFLTASAAATVASLLPGVRRGQALAVPPPERPLLFLVNCFGGASLLDSFLPVGRAECTAAGGDAERLLTYPDDLIVGVPGSPLRALKSNAVVDSLNHFIWNRSFFGSGLSPDQFLAAHHADMAILPNEVTSVSHDLAARRFMDGAGVDGGRTLLEAAALAHGAESLIPAVNMAAGGFRAAGTDDTLPDWARAWGISDSELFGLETHGQRGIPGLPGADADTGQSALVDRARSAREQLETLSPFGQTFRDDPLRQSYMDRRKSLLPALEGSGAIEQLLLVAGELEPALVRNGLQRSPALAGLPEDIQERLVGDEMMRQALLGFLLARDYGTVGVGIGYDFKSDQLGFKIIEPPLGFDLSHNAHPAAQGLMWPRVLHTVDFLIGLLKSAGMWQQSLIVIGTEFGRSRTRPQGAEMFGTAHHTNNGLVFVSPRIKGDKVYGAIDPTNLLTRRYDFEAGGPVALGTGYSPDREHVWTERDIFAAIGRVIDFPVAAATHDFAGLLKA